MDTTRAVEHSKRVLELRIEDFCSRWAPKNAYGYENHARFYAELMTIVTTIYREAQEPLLTQVVTMMNYVPFPRDIHIGGNG